MKYQTIPEKIDAEVYDGSYGSYIAIHALIKSVDPRMSISTKRGQVYYNTPEGSFHKVPRGNYVIVTANNEMYQLSCAEFIKKFVPIAPPANIPKSYNWFNRTTGQQAICFKHLATRFSRANIINTLGSIEGISFEIQPTGDLIVSFSGSQQLIKPTWFVIHEHGTKELIFIETSLELEKRYGYKSK